MKIGGGENVGETCNSSPIVMMAEVREQTTAGVELLEDMLCQVLKMIAPLWCLLESKREILMRHQAQQK